MIDGRRGRTADDGFTASDEFRDLAEALGPSHGEPEAGAGPGTASPARGFRRLARTIRLGSRLADHGVTADHVTVAGLFLAALTGTVIALGHLWTGVALVTAGGLMDTLDGAVAKAAGSASRRGAFFDSVSDRVADAFMFGGLSWYLAARQTPELALLPFGILAVGNLISYTRAKAESFGWDAKGGLMERAERLIGLGLALLFNVVLVPLLSVLLGLCVLTAVQRFWKVWRQATVELKGEQLPARATALSSATSAALAAWRPARVESRWRDWREARAATAAGSRPARAVRPARARRRAGEPLSTRLRSVLASERSGPVRSGRPTTPASVRREKRRQEGAATALRRRLGTGR
jgi:CDP-diacylglycerol--glycerol-3-phosphate 3-phosphatidyltransferase